MIFENTEEGLVSHSRVCCAWLYRIGMTMNLVGLLGPGAVWTSISTCCVALFGLIRPKVVTPFLYSSASQHLRVGNWSDYRLLFLAAPHWVPHSTLVPG